MKLAKLYGITMVMIVLYALGCTQERPMKKVLKERTLNKTLISEEADYLYVPSVVEAPRSSAATRPHWQGDIKRVRFQFAEKELRVYEVEKDSRFEDNVTNRKPVMSIPISHLDYKCVEDSYGECTQQEKENDEITWDKKKFFKPDFKDLAMQEVNFLPIEIENLFAPCYDELSSEFIDYELDEAALNIQVEKTFKSNILCLSTLDSLSDISFSVRYHYSFARLDTMTTADYKPMEYTRRDETQFGYFTTQNIVLDVDNNDTVISEKVLLNRWNPKRKVVYYLNEAFEKPQNAKIRQATEESVKVINAALEKAGTELRLELRGHDPNVKSGDIRHNMIVMVEDPQATGIIGYGPSVANPLTGEIVHARTVMYLGTIKKYLRQSYEEIIQTKMEEELEEILGSAGTANVGGSAATGTDGRVISSDIYKVRMLEDKVQMAKVDRGAALTEAAHIHDLKKASNLKRPGKDFVNSKLSVKKLKQLTVSKENYLRPSADLRRRLEVYSRHNAYPAELFNFSAAIEGEVDEVIEKVGAKPWDLLSDEEKTLVVETLLPYVWMPTLIHELGHNLGLRHNFAGSEDGANFYTHDELEHMGVKRPFKYSSVMDYAYRTTNELRVMGKYDVAALRFAYAGQVELADGNLVSLDEYRTLPDEALKAYQFCTDEHVAVNPGCKRFDEGTNLLEIAQHLIGAYHERYHRANFRNNRRNFSLYQDTNQLAFLENTFMTLRLMYERYESIKNDFDLPGDAPEWEEIPFLAELKTATLLSAAFFIDVLKTPDIMCAVATVNQPTSLVAIVPLKDLTPFAASCFDQENLQLREPYIIVGQGGRSFNSRKDPRSNNPYADQIDIRGIWLDKLVAAKYLLTRELDNQIFDDYTENYLHMPEVRDAIISTFQGLLLDELQGPVAFDSIFGFPFEIEFAYRVADQHIIEKPLSTATRYFLGLPNGQTTFNRQILEEMATRLPNRLHEETNRELLEGFAVLRELPRNGRDANDYRELKWKSERFYALTENKLAQELFTLIEVSQKLKVLDVEKLVAAVEKIKANPNAEAKTAEETAVKEIGVDRAERFVNGELKEEEFYVDTLRGLVSLAEGRQPVRVELADLIDALGKEPGL